MVKMASRKNLRKGLAGLVAGLIAAIALLAIALPVMMQYQQHITKSYHIKEYATMLEEQKELEKKGLASCYESSKGAITINNTLGRPVIIVLAYASDGENEEVKYYQPGIVKINPGPNLLYINNTLGFTLDPRKIKIIKLVTSRGTIIQPPYCREIVTIKREITVKNVTEWISVHGFPVNLYLGEEQIPGGLQAFVAIVFVYGFTKHNINDTNDIIIVNGTTVPSELGNIAFYIKINFIGFELERNDIGDYVILVYTPVPGINSRDYGCIGTSCYMYGDLAFNAKLYRFAYNYVSKYRDADAPDSKVDPLKYVLVNSGYNYLIVGTEASDFKLTDFPGGSQTFYYEGKIYIAKNKVSDPQDADIEVHFKAKHQYSISTGWSISIENVTINNGEVPNPKAFYRIYYSYLFKHLDQFAVLVPVEELLSIKEGDDLWVYAETSLYIPGGKTLNDTSDWIKYTYIPLKSIVDSWYEKYFGD